MDKRSQKTREAIIRAFRELLEEKGGIDQVSVRDIAARANISRSTSYSHYNDLNALTEAILGSYSNDISAIVHIKAADFDASLPFQSWLRSLFLELLRYLNGLDDLSRSIVLQSPLTNQDDELIRSIGNILLITLQKQNIGIEPEQLRDTSLFLIGGFSDLIRDWFRTKTETETVTDAADRLTAVFESLLLICRNTEQAK